jgi:hypothetical protein
MPLGAAKVALLGAAGSGGEVGWVVEPSSSSMGDAWVYGIALDDEENVWGTVLSPSNSELPLFQVLADGTAGASNNWKSIDPVYGSAYGRGVYWTGSKIVVTGDTYHTSGTHRSTMVNCTPGTLIQDWDNSLSYGTADTYQYKTPNVYKAGESSAYGCSYVYEASRGSYSALMYKYSLTDGSREVIDGSNYGFFAYSLYGQTWYPSSPILTEVSGDQWCFMAIRTGSAGMFGYAGLEVGTTTYDRRFYQLDAAGNGKSGGLAECDATYMYMTWGDDARKNVQLVKVNKSTGVIDWQREIGATNATNITSVAPPVVDSSGNIYVAWTQYDTDNIIDTSYRTSWAKWNSSGTLQTVNGSTMKSFFCSPGHGSPSSVSQALLNSDGSFLYLCGYTNSPYDPYILKLPTDGLGIDDSGSSLSGNTDGTYYYRSDIPVTEGAGTMVYNSQYGTVTSSAQPTQGTNPVADATAAASPVVRLDELA